MYVLCWILLLPLFALGSCGGAGPRPDHAGDNVPEPESKARPPWIVYEKTGGVAGFRLLLVVSPNGSWHVDDIARARELSGGFEQATVDSLRASFDALAPGAWGEYRSQVADDFSHRVVVHRGEQMSILEADGQTLPSGWRPILAILDRPFTELFMQPEP